jgi:hypothetical protein
MYPDNLSAWHEEDRKRMIWEEAETVRLEQLPHCEYCEEHIEPDEEVYIASTDQSYHADCLIDYLESTDHLADACKEWMEKHYKVLE